jgi:hypothetical protein
VFRAVRNPFRSEGEMFRFLIVVIAGAVLVVLGAVINAWVGVAAAAVVVAAIVWWLMQEPVPGGATPKPRLDSATPNGMHRVLVVVPPGGAAPTAIPDAATDVVVIVPALASTTEAITGAVDDRRAEAEQTALALTRQLSRDGRNVRGEVGADDPVQAVEDALRTFGADEVLVDGDDATLERMRSRVAVPVRRA